MTIPFCNHRGTVIFYQRFCQICSVFMVWGYTHIFVILKCTTSNKEELSTHEFSFTLDRNLLNCFIYMSFVRWFPAVFLRPSSLVRIVGTPTLYDSLVGKEQRCSCRLRSRIVSVSTVDYLIRWDDNNTFSSYLIGMRAKSHTASVYLKMS